MATSYVTSGGAILGFAVFITTMRNVADSAAVADLSMLSRGQEYHLVPGSQLSLDCEFYMESFNDFNNPIIWAKTQLHDRTTVTIVGMVLEPFESTRRFNVALIREPPRYRLILKIKEVTHQDSGNYTCEVRLRSHVLGSITHVVSVLEPVTSMYLAFGTVKHNRTVIDSHSVILSAGQSAPFQCVVVGGYPPPSVTLELDWTDVTHQFMLKRDVSVKGKRGLGVMEVISTRWTNTLLTHVFHHGRTLQCLAKVHGLQTVSSELLVLVSHKPEIRCSSRNARLNEAHVCIRCELTSRPAPTSVFWASEFSGSKFVYVETDGTGYWSMTRVLGDDRLEALLCMDRVREESFRTYTLVAENQLGTSQHAVDLLRLPPLQLTPATIVQTPSTLTRLHVHSPGGASELTRYLPPEHGHQNPKSPLAVSNDVSSARTHMPHGATSNFLAQLLVYAVFSVLLDNDLAIR